MDAAVIIGILGVLVSVATYYLGRRAGREEREADAREARVERLVDEYCRMALGRPRLDSGPSALIKAGVAELHTNDEVREALRRISQRGTGHPLGSKAEEMVQLDLLEGFREFVKQGRSKRYLDGEEFCEFLRSRR